MSVPTIVYRNTVSNAVPGSFLTAKLDNAGSHIPTPGNLVLLLASCITDGASRNGWTNVGTSSSGQCSFSYKIWLVGDTIGEQTCAAAATGGYVIAYEISGVSATPVDQTIEQTLSRPTTSYASAGVTPTLNNELLIAYAASAVLNTPITWTNGFSADLKAGVGSGDLASAYFSPGSSGTTYPTTALAAAGSGGAHGGVAMLSIAPPQIVPGGLTDTEEFFFSLRPQVSGV